ncbi:MAG TPA: sigma-70 family RNA polymerase sigma factor, partial [Clostridia bacterium]|nr:sigma-70 family RNA polymerase sigma factor [Clostridia bacterium]
EADPAYGPQTLLERSETSTEVQKAVAALPKKYREPIMLYYFAELDYKKIAALLQMNEGTLKSRMSRGRELIKKQLQKGGGLYA